MKNYLRHLYQIRRKAGISILGWLLLAMLHVTCLPDEEQFIGDHTEYNGLGCSGYGLPEGFQCLWDSQTSTSDDLVRYDMKGIHGTWYSKNTRRCLVFNEDGTGMITETEGASPKPIYWGVMVDSHGNNINGDSPVWRLKIMGENYTIVDPQFPQYHEDLELLGNYGYQHVSECGVEDINNLYGSITLWTADASLLPIHVTIAGQTKTIDQVFIPTSDVPFPECSATNCASFYLPQGAYDMEATCNIPNWHVLTTVDIYVGWCQRLMYFVL